MSDHFDTLVIGGGQAGLAVGYYLSRQGQEFGILDDHRRIGDNWRKRYDSLRLFTPAKYDRLPGMPFPASAYTFPTAGQVADYLECYAAHMRLPVLNGVKADGLWRASNGRGFVVTAGEQRFTAAQVVIATGMHQVPAVPAFASELDPEIRQLHSSEYRNPAQLAPGDVLVVGAGHSGADIAFEVSSAHGTWLSGPVHGQISLNIDSWKTRPLWWLLWFAAHHLLTARYPPVRGMTPVARGQGGPLLRVRLPQLAAAGVQHANSRVTGVRGGLPALEGGRVLTVANVIWCTGFRHDFGWIHLPVTGDHGWPRHDRGVARSVPGLYFVGLPFQYSFSSMLVGGVARDAKYVAKHIASSRLPQCQGTTPPTIDDLLLQARAGLARLDPVLALCAVHDGAILIDTRPEFQRRADGEIPGALIIDRNHLEWRCDPASPARIPEATGHDVRWIICCDQGYSSSLAAASLQALGLSSATDVIGGFQAWRAAGLPVTTPGRASTPRLA